MSEFGHAPATDPSLRAGNQKQIDPGVLALVANPDSLTDPAERRRAINESMRLTWPDSKVAFDEKGTPHFAQEVSDPGRLFAFNGTIRAPQDKANAPDQLTPGEQMMVIGNQIAGTATHLIIETDDGEMYLIKRTAESWNGDDQTFTIASTTQPEAGHRELPSRALKDVVAMIGEPLVMGKDESGKNLKTRGAVTKVTGFNMVNPLLIHAIRG